jgi:hypothetical protein
LLALRAPDTGFFVGACERALLVGYFLPAGLGITFGGRQELSVSSTWRSLKMAKKLIALGAVVLLVVVGIVSRPALS